MIRVLALLCLLLISASQGGEVKRIPIKRDHRIINGVPANQGEFPSQVSLQYGNGHYCGASVLNEDWVLTASHCVDGNSPSVMSVVSGTVDLNSGGTRHQIEQIIMHEGYNDLDSWVNDVAVVRLATPLDIDGVNIKPVALPAAGENPADNSLATVIGWGYLVEGGPLSDILMKVDIAITNQDACNDVYGSIGYPIYDGHICADTPEGNKGSCNGDSGGPLFVDGVVVGLVSWAMGCSRPGYPTVYTRVSAYRDWIAQQTGV